MRRLAGRIARLARSRAAKRAGLALLVVAVAFLWGNMVRRVVDGPAGTQYDDFVAFSRDLLYARVNVYDVYPAWNTITKYPPFFAFLLAPLVPLPQWLGASVWFWLSLAMAWGSARLAADLAHPDPGAPPRALAAWPLVAVGGIVVSNLETAQVNLAILFLTLWGLVAWRRGADATGGALVGVATALKLTPAIVVAWFAWKRSWRAVAGAVAGLGLCWLVLQPVAFGPGFFVEAMRGWLGAVSPFVSEGTIAEGIGGFRHTNQSLSAAVHRTLTDVPAGAGREGWTVNVAAADREAVRWLVRALQVAIVLALGWLCRTPPRDRARIGIAFEASLVLAATLYLSPIAWINHYVALLPAYAAAVAYVGSRPASLPERRFLLTATIASAVLLATAVSRVALALSIPFLGGALLVVAVAVAHRRERARAAAGGAQ